MSPVKPAQLLVYQTREFTPPLEALRRQSIRNAHPELSTEDAYDQFSVHIVMALDGTPIAMTRLTPAPHHVFKDWSGGTAEVPLGAGVVDLGRLSVDSRHRTMSIPRLLALEALLRAHRLGYHTIVGAPSPGCPLITLAKRLRLITTGQIVTLMPPTANITINQLMVALTEDSLELWQSLHRKVCERLAAAGYLVESDLRAL